MKNETREYIDPKIYTRKQYLDAEVSHEEYYGQFVDSYTKRLVPVTLEVIRQAYLEDEHLNNIPLKKWDDMTLYVNHWELGEKLKEAGESLTRSVQVCILKRSAIELLKEARE